MTWALANWKMLLVAALMGLLGLQQIRVEQAKTETASAEGLLADEKRARAVESDLRNRVALRESERVAALQTAHAAQQQGNLNAFNKEKGLRTVADAARRAADDQLRYVISAFTAGGGPAGEGDAAACRVQRDRSERLGGLLSEALDLASEGERVVRKRDAEVIFLKTLVNNDRALLTEKRPE